MSSKEYEDQVAPVFSGKKTTFPLKTIIQISYKFIRINIDKTRIISVGSLAATISASK